jgi:hypothetical protein
MNDEASETERGRALFRELLWVHRVLRRDLAAVRHLADDVLDGLPADDLHAEIGSLKTTGPLWQLKVNCLRYCRFVHLHHGAEDVMLFPALRRANPDLGPVVDRLEAEHRRMSDLLDRMEAAAAALAEADSDDARQRVADSLNALADHLLTHLEFEELEAGPTIRRLEHL